MTKSMRIALLSAMLAVCLIIPSAETTIHNARRGPLWQIAKLNTTAVTAVVEAHILPNIDLIYVEHKLKVLAGGTLTSYAVLPGDTLWLIAQKFGVTVPELLAINVIPDSDHIVTGQRMYLPARGGTGVPAAPENIPVQESVKTSVKETVKETAKTPEKAPVKTTTANTTTSRNSALYSAAELDLFARLVHAESAGEPFQGQVAVAASILNRVRSSRYPNTLSGVIYQIESGYYQYSPVLDGRINLPADDTARRAVKEAISGSDPSKGALGFYNPRKTSNQWVRSQPVTTTIGNHVFFR
jgi:N-acetylmuramoyl-L-alanine amidase